jgi:hypothetical protein
MVIRSGRSPGSVHGFPPFPAFASGMCGSLPITVARPRRILTGFPIKAACHPCGLLFSFRLMILWFTVRQVNKNAKTRVRPLLLR